MKPTPRSPKGFGLIIAGPSEHLVHQRLGRVRHLGRGAAAWVLPGLDRALLIPLAAQTVTFEADQITAENQGVAIGGFVIWNVADPERAGAEVDFSDPGALDRLGGQLREVVEAAIRREVANQTLEQVLRQRAAMTELLRQELLAVAGAWGLHLASIEIKSVTILSRTLFENMQAKFRDAVRLESAKSAMEADAAIARERAAEREEEARRDLTFRLAGIEREEEARRLETERDRRLEAAKEAAKRERELALLDDELALVQARAERRRAALADAEALVELEEALETRRFQIERLRVEQRERIAALDDAIARRAIETANLKDPGRLLIEALPEALAALNVGTVNLGDPALVAGLQALVARLARRDGSENPQSGQNRINRPTTSHE
jgi:flotillin